ncbi:MAG: DNA-protecting protein DprA [Lentisphaerae bacterium]|nr:DNA-protecting protein DprA [Lentisphaerota bacterium]
MDTLDAYVVLNQLPGIGPLRVAQLLQRYGSPQAILSAPSAELSRLPGLGGKLAGVLSGWRDYADPEAERRLAERGGVTILACDSPDYPELLREIHDPPLCLYCRGSIEALRRCAHGLAMVGSRRTTLYGTRMAEHLALGAAYAGWPVVSGLARGIDTVVHDAVLKARGCTVAVLGSGLGQIYPQENVALARRIAEAGGAVISEFPMDYHPDKRTFPMRNRIISGMTLGTVVIEAGATSGSLITAGQAAEQGRQVFAVPGRVDTPQARGCHALIKDGAKLVECFEDIAEEFTRLPGLPLETPATGAAGGVPEAASGTADGAARRPPPAAGLELSPLEETLLASLDTTEVGIDDLIAAVGAPTAEVLSALLRLEMRRLVRQLPGRRVVRNQPPAGR